MHIRTAPGTTTATKMMDSVAMTTTDASTPSFDNGMRSASLVGVFPDPVITATITKTNHYVLLKKTYNEIDQEKKTYIIYII